MARKREKMSHTSEDVDKLTRIRTGLPREGNPACPLGPEHLHALNTVIKECEVTANMCKDCQEAGIDVEPEMATNAEQLQMAKALKAKFFPHSA